MSLKGPAFQADNGDVFYLLIQHTENTEGYTIVSNNEKMRNGRKSCVELSIHFKGSTFKEWVAQEAATTLKHASYSGPKRNFTFGDYYSLHAGAHARLLRVNTPMTVEQQIDGFIQGMQCATAQSIVINLVRDQVARQSFDSYYNAVASRLELSLSLTNRVTSTENKNVNEFKQKRTKLFTSDAKNKAKRQKTPSNKGFKSPFVPDLKIYENLCGTVYLRQIEMPFENYTERKSKTTVLVKIVTLAYTIYPIAITPTIYTVYEWTTEYPLGRSKIDLSHNFLYRVIQT